MPSEADPSIWVLRNKVGAVLALFYVDDGIVAAKSNAEAEAIVNMVASIFKTQAWGAQRLLGIHIQRNCERGTISIDQEDKAMELETDLGENGHRKATPMTPETFAGLRMAKSSIRPLLAVCCILHNAQGLTSPCQLVFWRPTLQR